MSLRQVEEKAGISNAYLSQVESGKRGVPTLKLLRKLASAYGVAVTELLEQVEGASPRDSELVNLTTDSAYVARAFEELSDERKELLLDYLKFLEASDRAIRARPTFAMRKRSRPKRR